MKLGLYASVANPPAGEDLDRCVGEAIAEAELAEAAGFGGFFLGEHHQDRDGFLPSPLVVCAAVAARTKTIAVGTSVILLPLHHPVKVAEDVATLDIVSGGRAVIGVGLGYQSADFNMFNVDRQARAAVYEECITVLRRCWSGERFTFDGEHFKLNEVQMLPPPLQRPMPLWLGAWAPRAVRRAAERGDGWIAGPSAALHEVEPMTRQYRSAAAAAGREARIILMRDGWAAKTRAEAERVYGPEVITAYRYYWRNGALAFRNVSCAAELTVDKVAPDRLILGTASECVDQLGRWAEVVEPEMVLLRLRHAHSGGPPHAEIMKAIEYLGAHVIPEL